MINWRKIDRELILASGSPRRKEILTQMGVEFAVKSPKIEDETQFFNNGDSVLTSIKKLSEAKANSVADSFPSSLVLGSDTIVYFENKVYGKPSSREEAVETLRLFSGSTHSVITAVSLICKETGFIETELSETFVTFRNIDAVDLDHYLSNNSYADKAGSYGIQDEALSFVEKINGCYNNVVGLPISVTIELLNRYINS
jgi:septum formation protein